MKEEISLENDDFTFWSWTDYFFQGMCTYKGVQYQAGERWEDGCDFTCTCTDALRGHYECVDR